MLISALKFISNVVVAFNGGDSIVQFEFFEMVISKCRFLKYIVLFHFFASKV
jgi:hypothetical protein